MIRTFITAALASLFAAGAEAQSDTLVSDKVITNAVMAGVGATEILDTYLSPEKYHGVEVRFLSHTTRRRDGRRWSRQLVHQGSLSTADNRSGNGGEIAGMYDFAYTWHRNWPLMSGRLLLKAGVTADANVGFVYNTRNGNNPAQARMSLDVSPSAVAEYGFRLWNRPFKARYELGVPLVGLMFSPNYGQSYYEIFVRGDYDHNIVPTTFVSNPSLRQMLTLDFSIGRTTFRLGYLGDMRQSEVNNLRSHIYTHAFVIGIVRQFKLIKLRP